MSLLYTHQPTIFALSDIAVTLCLRFPWMDFERDCNRGAFVLQFPGVSPLIYWYLMKTRSRHIVISDGNHKIDLTVKPCLSTWPEMDTQGSVRPSAVKQLRDGRGKLADCQLSRVCLVCMEPSSRPGLLRLVSIQMGYKIRYRYYVYSKLVI